MPHTFQAIHIFCIVPHCPQLLLVFGQNKLDYIHLPVLWTFSCCFCLNRLLPPIVLASGKPSNLPGFSMSVSSSSSSGSLNASRDLFSRTRSSPPYPYQWENLTCHDAVVVLGPPSVHKPPGCFFQTQCHMSCNDSPRLIICDWNVIPNKWLFEF